LHTIGRAYGLGCVVCVLRRGRGAASTGYVEGAKMEAPMAAFYYDPFYENIDCGKNAKLFYSYYNSKRKLD
jgi:hypothetical protein